MKLVSPPRLKAGDTIGIVTPSWPAHSFFPEKFEHGRNQIHKLGFKTKLGSLTARGTSEGYRSGSPRDRAAEINEMFADPSVAGVITTIGGSCSVATIEYLDFDVIRANPKVFCGYSDITSLHLALMVKAGLRTFYGPAVVPSFGEHPNILPYSRDSFLDAVVRPSAPRVLMPPAEWSNEMRDAFTDGWKTGARLMHANRGWQVLRKGSAEGPVFAFSLNTFAGLLGSDVRPDLRGAILIIEDMNSEYGMDERKLWQLRRSGVFKDIAGLIVSKAEKVDSGGAPFGYDKILMEAVGDFSFPVVNEFDCGHTCPTITIPQGVRASLAAQGGPPGITFLETGVL